MRPRNDLFVGLALACGAVFSSCAGARFEGERAAPAAHEAASAATSSAVPSAPVRAEPARAADPTQSAVALEAQNGWDASLVLDNGTVGIWTLGIVKAFPLYGCPEIVGLDDRGRCWVLWSYSGKWTPVSTVEDGEWLGTIAQIELDPRIPGPEIYVGGKKGNVYQIRFHQEGGVDCNLIARFPGQEVHWFSAGDLRPERAGDELIVHLLRGEAVALEPNAAPGNGFATRTLADFDARVRQSLLLPSAPGKAPWIACATRAGEVLLLRCEGDRLERGSALREPMGIGRIALKPRNSASEPLVLYVTRDDGLVLRLESVASTDDWSRAPWKREAIYAGPQGPRGIAAGRFDADPRAETVAVFGYSARVQLLTRRPGANWIAEDIFRDRDKGHWLMTAELDGRNSTDELVCSGYGGRIVLLARPPGHGLPGTAVEPQPARSGEPSSNASALAPALRVAVRASAAVELSPLRYSGGFEAKAAVYETLVRLDAHGELAPALADSWSEEERGRVLVLRLREGARFHDGSAVDAEAVRQHFARWVGLPEHAWLRSSAQIESVRARSPRELEIRLREPCALLRELCAFNPCAVRAPAALDAEGDFVAPLGSGSLRIAREASVARRTRLERWPSAESALTQLELVRIDPGDPRSALDLLLAGEVDLAAEGWNERFPRERLASLTDPARWRLERLPGSCVDYLAFRLEGATASADLRRAIATAIDRARLVERVEGGFAAPCARWAAPNVREWPAASVARAARANQAPAHEPLVLAIAARDERQGALALELAAQLNAAGLRTSVCAEEAPAHAARIASGQYDLCLERTWGVPYDPWITLAARFLPPTSVPAAAGPARHGVHARLRELVLQASRASSEAERVKLFAPIQQLIDEEAVLVPLLVPERLLALRAELPPVPGDHDLYRLDFATWLERVDAQRARAGGA
jgi:ABC-type transport system substrate-binding protein